ncbi:hypothetical protein C1Y63_00900 [Corynebacterium sp. 13CS0277]|uniref:hypothetical protein n=1 Tax=Corynebacterium sp. 13CS0277 TaxID=2071994 RepID=UPI000D024276|nr:hypothetical protein [Corynebacterium sp. 13CS0277]PRQ12384.1 hypothetical protein C1Y63_00900 [Corynebacterium sp. 13CS0277]
MTRSWSFYGARTPAGWVAAAWFIILALPSILVVDSWIGAQGTLIFWFTTCGGLGVVASAIRLRSWLLLILGVFVLGTYIYLAFFLLGFAP